MKSIGMLVVLLLLVAGIAVNGSRAGSLPSTSVAFEQCQGMEEPVRGRCRPLAGPMIAQVEGFEGREFSNADNVGSVDAREAGASVDPEHDWRMHLAEILRGLLQLVANEVGRHFLGGSLPYSLEAGVIQQIFDPTK